MGAFFLFWMACIPADYADVEPESIPPPPAFGVELGSVMACDDPRDSVRYREQGLELGICLLYTSPSPRD